MRKNGYGERCLEARLKKPADKHTLDSTTTTGHMMRGEGWEGAYEGGFNVSASPTTERERTFLHSFRPLSFSTSLTTP